MNLYRLYDWVTVNVMFILNVHFTVYHGTVCETFGPMQKYCLFEHYQPKSYDRATVWCVNIDY